MKKLLTAACALSTFFSAFAFDSETVVPAGTVKSYTKTNYTISSKFGTFYRTPETKYVHTYNNAGLEAERTETTGTDVLTDRMTFQYDMSNLLLSTTLFNADGVQTQQTAYTYDSDDRISTIEVTSKDGILISKTVFKIADGREDKSDYDGEGALVKKTISVFADDGKPTEIFSYNGNGSLAEKETYSYDVSRNLTEITYFDANEKKVKRESYRYKSGESTASEIQVFDSADTLLERRILTYDEKGNITKISTYTVSQKFGETVTELSDIVEYSFQY